MLTTATTNRLYKDPWFYVRKPQPNATVRLFCFTYAGGSATVFRDWSDYLPESIEVCSVQLPGRGARFKEPTVDCLETLLDKLAPAILPYLDKPFAFFGHSMGATIAYELTRKLKVMGKSQPVQLMVSGRKAPQLPATKKPIHHLPEAEFISEITKLNGTPEEAIQHPELMEIVSPILRADCKLVETWQYEEEGKLDVSITAFGGAQDSGVSREQLDGWRCQTSKQFAMHLFEGDHFYINHQRNALLRRIDNILTPIARSYAQFRNHGRMNKEFNIA